MENTKIWNRNPKLTAGIGVAVLAGVAWLAFGFFGIQSAFIDNEVNEAGPAFGSAEEAEILDSDDFLEAMTEAEENRTESDDDMPPMPGEIVTLVSGEFSGNSRYEINGEALVLNDGTDERFLRFENFNSSNGPDLKVYLRAESGEFVSLGDLKGNIGDQNYEIPTDVELDEFSTVEIWCERFGVGFGQAELA
ncbi:MAG: DM13 domain-containing protein [Acidimicrobiales bacterium]